MNGKWDKVVTFSSRKSENGVIDWLPAHALRCSLGYKQAHALFNLVILKNIEILSEKFDQKLNIIVNLA